MYKGQLGADLAVDAGVDDFRSAVMEATGGRGAALVVEAVGSRGVPAEFGDSRGRGDCRLVRPAGGRDDYSFSFHEFFRRRLTARTEFGTQGEPGLESFRYAVRLIADGALDVAPLLSPTLPIERVDEAFRIALTGPTTR